MLIIGWSGCGETSLLNMLLVNGWLAYNELYVPRLMLSTEVSVD